MYCPKCRSEFREGFTFCESCNENLVDELPSEVKSGKNAVPAIPDRAKNMFCVEKWLKGGAIVYVIVGLLSAISGLFFFISNPPHVGRTGAESGWTFFQITQFVSTVAGLVMWGAFFYGLGVIIEILKGAFSDEEI